MNDTEGASPAGRRAALEDWIRSLPGMQDAGLVPASVDASFRRYFRVNAGGSTWIAMDAPPPMEDCRPFVEIAAYLRGMSLNGPDIVAGDTPRGFLLMTDLGTRTYLDVIREDEALLGELYADAIDALLMMQSRGEAFQGRLPPYDEALLRAELGLFRDWLCERHLGLAFSDGDEQEWQVLTDLLVDNALAQPQVFVHRDYHSRNLMVTPTDNPGILDFQDAVEGPLAYDLVSLLKDCYISLGSERVATFSERYFEGLDADLSKRIGRQRFATYFELMGVQRHLKAAGIFARLLHRDGKDGYMPDVPRTLSYIVEAAPLQPSLRWLAALIESRCLPALEAQE